MSHLRTLTFVVLAAACGNVQKTQPDANLVDAPSATLTVNVSGAGHVTSTPAGIDCTASCMGSFEEGTTITLVPASDSAAAFNGWGGACSGAGGCEVVLRGDTTVTANFGCASGMMTFDFTGAPQSWSPPCATTFNFDVRGAAGGLGWGVNPLGTATLGGRVQASLVLHPTDVLNIYVGGVGADGTTSGPGAGGYNGGGTGGAYTASGPQCGGGGGGATDIRLNGAALTDRAIVAGGAGGVASCGNIPVQGGGGGGLTGGDGAQCNASANDITAKGGTQSAGGAGGMYPGYCQAAAGTSGAGAPGCAGAGGGGAGGGWFGGGGGSWNGGAGGSSFTSAAATNVVHTQGFQPGNGQVIITW